MRRFLAGAEYEPPAQTDDLDGLRAELADAEEELRELVESKEPISPAVLAARGRVLEVRVAEAQAQLDRAEAVTIAPPTFATSAEAWETLSVPEKRKIITALLGKVVVRQGRGLGVADRIARPDAPNDKDADAHPAHLNDDDKVKLVERFAELLREEQAAGRTLL